MTGVDPVPHAMFFEQCSWIMTGQVVAAEQDTAAGSVPCRISRKSPSIDTDRLLHHAAVLQSITKVAECPRIIGPDGNSTAKEFDGLIQLLRSKQRGAQTVVRIREIRFCRHRLAMPLDRGGRITFLMRYQAHQMERMSMLRSLRKNLTAKFARLVQHAIPVALHSQLILVFHCHQVTMISSRRLVNRVQLSCRRLNPIFKWGQ